MSISNNNANIIQYVFQCLLLYANIAHAATAAGRSTAAAAGGGRPSAARPAASTVLSFSRCVLMNLIST